jgi:outer membrane lipopolysaccharide assembly protein LptE/RlpB
MKKLMYTSFFAISALLITACGAYSFTGATTSAETIQVSFFRNEATLVEPTLSQRFTPELQDLFLRQTNLTLVNNPNADLRLEGEITGYRINPMSATAQQTAAQNRLTVTINVRFYNASDEEKDFEKSFSFYSDFSSSQQLVGGILEGALDEILERIHQDIFNAALGDW